jgi:hypothetical protein
MVGYICEILPVVHGLQSNVVWASCSSAALGGPAGSAVPREYLVFEALMA